MKQFYSSICIFVCILISLHTSAQEVEVATTGLINPIGLAKKGNDLFICSVGNASIRTKDLSDTSSTATSSFLQGVNFGGFMTMHGNDLYIPLLAANKVVKVDVTSSNPVLTDVVTNIFTPMGLAFRNNELYISLRTERKIIKIDVTQSNPTPVDVITQIPGTLVNGIAFYGDELYITHSGTVSKTNVTDANPTLTEVVANLGAINIAIDNDFLYITRPNVNTVSRINISQPLFIIEEVLTLDNDPWGILIDGNNLYISEQLGARVVSLDLSTLGTEESTEKKFSSYPNPTKDHLYIAGLKNNTSYVLNDQHGREIMKGNLASTDQLNLSTLANGMYFLKLDNYEVKKIVKY